jgi:hypothetical protein
MLTPLARDVHTLLTPAQVSAYTSPARSEVEARGSFA